MLWWVFHTVAGLMVVLVVLVLVLVVMYKLWAQEQQLAAAESNANLCGSTELRRLGCCR